MVASWQDLQGVTRDGDQARLPANPEQIVTALAEVLAAARAQPRTPDALTTHLSATVGGVMQLSTRT